MMRVALAIQILLVNVGGLLAYNFIKNEFLQVYILRFTKQDILAHKFLLSTSQRLL